MRPFSNGRGWGILQVVKESELPGNQPAGQPANASGLQIRSDRGGSKAAGKWRAGLQSPRADPNSPLPPASWEDPGFTQARWDLKPSIPLSGAPRPEPGCRRTPASKAHGSQPSRVLSACLVSVAKRRPKPIAPRRRVPVSTVAEHATSRFRGHRRLEHQDFAMGYRWDWPQGAFSVELT
jgi:hypothetical protein